ncbi:hypothetical protein H704_00694 [Bartonella bacilliformis Peru38]|uniref:Uncharacterized protein n=2 Tax=Bartonella bacilliformis TaxID=774 RepID=A1USW2_BARBK|nr:hypothetical protein BARBAKC583_0771 [Bartonella bacilliformis KC583]EKS44139.1 hypothetical protein BbINS_03632 [Bartonella bacilliformis INS]EYS89933.1 hypothetical protein X472_00380 [Bartonella bacilliformis San Pedro600-02]EYS95276.1 hypothetical protein X470_00800 [Bartonella bacilliformis Peru-18]KEG17345.1 hypothetical protein H709_00692 [Bartonella bacilliformis CUSCO5]KEG20453.1 hypothetical protein H704_00694 [Bartonella bacilliformis Peru38]KEG22835.1 hypothetical protein H703_
MNAHELMFFSIKICGAVMQFISWKDVTDNIIHLKTEKSQFQTDVFLSILPKLAATLATDPIGDETFICSKSSKKFTKESFGNNIFRKARN